jgi:hypothetical protein
MAESINTGTTCAIDAEEEGHVAQDGLYVLGSSRTRSHRAIRVQLQGSYLDNPGSAFELQLQRTKRARCEPAFLTAIIVRSVLMRRTLSHGADGIFHNDIFPNSSVFQHNSFLSLDLDIEVK